MDRVKAIEVLKPLVNSYVDYANITMKEEDDNIAEALEMAIEALKQPEPSIPLSWIEKHIEWLKSLDNEFINLAAAHISVMVKKWRGEQHEND